MKELPIRSQVIGELELLASPSNQLTYEASLTRAGHAPTELVSVYCDDIFNLKNPDLISAFSNAELKDLAMLYGLIRGAFTTPPECVTEMLKTPGWREVVAFAKDLSVRIK